MNSIEVDKKEHLVDEQKVTPINRNREKRTRAYRKLEKKQIRTRNVAALISLILICGVALSVASLKRVSNENRILENDLNQANLRIEALMNDSQDLRLENDNLVQGRIPGLIPIKFDDPFKIENQMLKSVVFTETQHNGQKRYEYLAVVRNNTEDVMRPASLLIFFNKLGVEVGKGRIAIALGFDNQVKMISLQPGESHSFTGSIEMISDDEPKYFKLIEQ
ncbi:MAG: hypothetical protein AB8D52_05160 [Gammaproteobacteria bacterium]